MGSQTVEAHTFRILHFDPRQLALRIRLSIEELAMGAGKLPPQDLALVLARPELCNGTQSLGRFVVFGSVVTSCVCDGPRRVPLTMAELL